MLVSIIIPCYNNARYVGQTLRSALSQSYPYIEVIVIDDGSTDKSIDKIRPYVDRITLIRQPNRGAPAARNNGLRVAKGKLIKFLDADDILLPDAIDKQVKQMKKIATQGKKIVYGPVQWIDQFNNPTNTYQPRPRKAGACRVAHILAESPLTSAPLHRKSYLDQIGGFDESIPKGQEFDLHLRLVLNGVEFVYFNQQVYLFREHYTNTRISHLNFRKHTPETFLKIFSKQEKLIQHHFNGVLPPPIRELLARRYWTYGRKMLQSNYPEASIIYFERAKLLFGNKAVFGNFPYPQMAKIFGPVRAESWTSKLKAIRS